MSAKPFRVYINEVLDFTGESHRLLADAGVEVIYGRSMWQDPDRPMTEQELIESCREVDAVMGASRDRYTRRFMESCPRLRIISKYGIGTEKIDTEAATELGILVGHTPVPQNYESVAEHAISLMLALLRRHKQLERFLKQGGWRGPETIVEDLAGKTVGLIGLGRIGNEVARRLRNWDVRLMAYDPYCDPSVASQYEVELVRLDDLLQAADIVTVHVVVTPETRRMLNERSLGMMKRTAYLVNTSRGEVIDEAALYRALVQGRLAGAALDVFDPEPPARSSPLLELDNVVVSPHVAGFSLRSLQAISIAASENVLAALRNEVPRFIKNPEAIPRWRERLARLEGRQ